VVGLLDLSAALTGQVALVQRLQFHDERELILAPELLLGQIYSHGQ
jgi:hypothetical protein